MQATGFNHHVTPWTYTAGLEKEAEMFKFNNNKMF